ncbi:MAG: glucose-6-phosphate dehydrogenase [Pseudonocardia sp. SCN 72-86]|nr:MAG: glucose-6-phosphate dehydrogenase [Pseudonocardia sp. SCN 72-86]
MTAPSQPVAGDVLVLFGISGDLAHKKILPALYRLTERGELTVPVVGVALTDWDTDALRSHAADAVREVIDDVDDAVLQRFQDLLTLVAGDYSDAATFTRLADEVHSRAKADDPFVVHYLAVPPSLFGTVADALASVGLQERARLVVEKPFGHDLASARALNAELAKNYTEDQVFRVDHYLGKESVEDLLVLRFANTVFEPLWSRSWVERIEITMAESFDVADRGSFYDAVGTVRDVLQNHLLQVLAYLTMEAPGSDAADDQRDAKHALLASVRAIDPAETVRGQYTGYLDVPGVKPGSTTETFVSVVLHIDDWRWSGVPVHIRAGKALPETLLEIDVVLQSPPRPLFTGADDAAPPANRIRIRLQPDSGVTFFLLAKQPGKGDVAVEVPVGVDLRQVLGLAHEPYERIFGDALVGDPAHFARFDTLEEAWRIVAPILDATTTPEPYAPGTWGPAPVTDGTTGSSA